jgi:malonate-semialdehyde dehydrogenase (acetylating)/methylmalonate-semialdehyde dehydrogenase
VPIPVPVAQFSFNGSRASKLGDLGPYGKQAITFYTHAKTVTARWENLESSSDAIATLDVS